MRAVLTRVKHASVTIDGKVHGQIGEGFLILLGVTHEDTEAQAHRLPVHAVRQLQEGPPPGIPGCRPARGGHPSV